MQADPNERTSQHSERGGPPLVPVIAGIVVLLALGVWLFSGQEDSPAVVEAEPAVETPVPQPEPEQPPAPDIPPPPESQPEPLPEPEPEPEPAEPALTLDASDGPLREMLEPVLPPTLVPALETANLVERGAAVVDGLSRGVLRYKVLPLLPPEGRFVTRKTAGQDFMDPSGYARYDAYAQAIESLDTDALVATFHSFRPLLEEAYGYLGYKPENLDNAVIRGLDNIIAAPVVNETIPVRKIEAVYKYVDADLEQLPDVQKQLLRMGPENTRIIQAQARALRAALLGESAAP